MAPDFEIVACFVIAHDVFYGDGPMIVVGKPRVEKWVDVGDGHSLYVTEWGNPNGPPVVFLHGGPGDACPDLSSTRVDQRFRIVLLHQRGAGKSTPSGSLVNNTTGHLLDDLEVIRKDLGIKQWMAAGGSWGSTLAMAYAYKYPRSVSGLLLWSVWLGRTSDVEFLFGKDGEPPERLLADDDVSKGRLAMWKALVAPLNEQERKNLSQACQDILNDPTDTRQSEMIKRWGWYFGSLSQLTPFTPTEPGPGEVEGDRANVLIETLYESHGYFLNEVFGGDDPENNHILRRAPGMAKQLRGKPISVLHGEIDAIAPLQGAGELAAALGVGLSVVPRSGHALRDNGNTYSSSVRLASSVMYAEQLDLAFAPLARTTWNTSYCTTL